MIGETVSRYGILDKLGGSCGGARISNCAVWELQDERSDFHGRLAWGSMKDNAKSERY